MGHDVLCGGDESTPLAIGYLVIPAEMVFTAIASAEQGEALGEKSPVGEATAMSAGRTYARESGTGRWRRWPVLFAVCAGWGCDGCSD